MSLDGAADPDRRRRARHPRHAGRRPRRPGLPHRSPPAAATRRCPLPRASGPTSSFSTSGCPTATASRRCRRCASSIPAAAVVMMSGHGTTVDRGQARSRWAPSTTSRSRSPTSRRPRPPRRARPRRATRLRAAALAGSGPRPTAPAARARSPPLRALRASRREPQRTIRQPTVVYGLGLHSGGRTGHGPPAAAPRTAASTSSPCPPGDAIPAHVAAVGDTEYATTLVANGATIKTVEHLLSALHAAGSPTC